MRLRSNIITIPNWTFNAAKRKHRFRCQVCAKLVGDGSTLIIERRGKSSHGFHADCFDGSFEAVAALAREAERQSPEQPVRYRAEYRLAHPAH